MTDAVPLLAIHPRIPPRRGAKREYSASFGCRSTVLPPPIAFPRAPMEPALAEHARLLQEHLHEILHAALDDEWVALHHPWGGFNDNAAILAAGDDGRREMRVWYREDASWVVRRCRGLVRKLMEAPPHGRMYVIVIARGVASLHVAKGTGQVAGRWSPFRRRVNREGLGLKVVSRDVVVEPWEQWHYRDPPCIETTWSLPDGASGRGEVLLPGKPRTLREGVERVLTAYEQRITADVEVYARQNGPEGRLVLVRSNLDFGDKINVVPAQMNHAFLRESHPTIRRVVLRGGADAFDPVYVILDHGAGLRWRSRGEASDVGEPPPLNELTAESGD